MNSQFVDDPIIIKENATLLIIGAIAALAMASGFRKSMVSNRSARILFFAMILAAATLLSYSVCFLLPHEHPHNAAFTAFAILGYLGFYAFQLQYIRYLVEKINTMRPEAMPPHAVIIQLVFCLISGLLWILSLFEGWIPIPEVIRTNYDAFFWIGHVGEIAFLILSLWLLLSNRQYLTPGQIFTLASPPAMIMAATLLEPLTNGISLRYPAIFVSMIIVFANFHAGTPISFSTADDANTTLYPLTKNRLKPHFVNNILTSIYYLCDGDASKAQNQTRAFSGYLLNTLDTMNRQAPVQFAVELDLVRNYLTLEKQRLDEQLRVDYDVDVVDFKVPPLSILALVENAVKHGIVVKEGFGTVRIVTRRAADGSVQVRIIDNGVGFDVEAIEGTAAAHELDEIRNLIRQEVNGDMRITSEPGKGTTVTVTLPPERDL
jgi:hypothetical protein